ncbi:MAG TPA: DUF2147 domain-containing protein, partial [Candidatus Binatus sp.]|nr:DUF2147 domain-containing protein [Candidatus Binatus sp.]
HRNDFKMRKFAPVVFALVWLAILSPPASYAAGAASPIGTWATEKKGAHIEIKDCGGKLCGTIVWLKNPHDKNGQDSIDSKNPEPALRSRKLLGMPLLNGFVQDSDSNVWTGGTIYDPDSGKTYSCKLTMQDDGTMQVRGYVGISLLGQTQIWTRVN